MIAFQNRLCLTGGPFQSCRIITGLCLSQHREKLFQIMIGGRRQRVSRLPDLFNNRIANHCLSPCFPLPSLPFSSHRLAAAFSLGRDFPSERQRRVSSLVSFRRAVTAFALIPGFIEDAPVALAPTPSRRRRPFGRPRWVRKSDARASRAWSPDIVGCVRWRRQ